MSDIEIIREEDVSSTTLSTLFKRAFLKSRIDDDGDLIVETDGPRIFVIVDTGKKFIKFMTLFSFKQGTLSQKYQFVNKMNDDFVFSRFSVPEHNEDTLVADYYLSYSEGVPAFQVVNSLRYFSRVVPGAIRASDDDDLVS